MITACLWLCMSLSKGGADILNRCIPIPLPVFMDEKPGIVKFTPHSTSRSAMLIAVAVTVGVQVALCAVLVAIHLQDMGFPPSRVGKWK